MKNQSDKSEVPKYPTWSEFSSKKFLNIATALGIGVTASALPLSVTAKDKPVAESKKSEDVNKKVKDQIVLLATNLGHKDFNERNKATTLLISMGNKYNKEKNLTMTKFLKTELDKSSNSKDPEVKKRSKMILLAITPKPVKRPDHPVLRGKIRAAGGMRAPR